MIELMIIKPAQINNIGSERILEFANSPSKLQLDHGSDQCYVPGISVPNVPGLESSFSVPIVGDNESVTLSVDWPQKDTVSYIKRVSLVGMLVAECVLPGEYLTDPYTTYSNEESRTEFSDESDFLGYLLGPNLVDEDLDAAFDKYTGEWGGFLRAVVDVSNLDADEITYTSHVEFICMENEADFEFSHSLIEHDLMSAGEVVSFMRIAELREDDAKRSLYISRTELTE